MISEFKKPLGKLYPNFEDAIPDIKKADFLISVGDQTTKNLKDNDLTPHLGIIDNRIQRKDHSHDLIQNNILEVNNPAGTITDDLWETIESAIKAINTDGLKRQIVVKGEEDLAVLPCILIAPEDTIILYGQPNEGLVYVKASDVKSKAKELMSYSKH
ncbi:GTP-dependent dephospho-CoA kinase family protein [Methanobrevibacter acididurans]|uniref:GTP-dependent dephospho-CoA kinase family protein n=1 Tax=Methanobrevibacter acididurans TaxID=120963 RepID=UPI0038FCECDB